MHFPLNGEVIQDPTPLLAWVKDHAGTLRRQYAIKKMENAFGTDFFVVTTTDHVWASYMALSLLTTLPEFVELKMRQEKDELDLFLEIYFAVRTPMATLPALPEKDKLSIPVNIIPAIPLVLGLRKLH